MGIRRNLLRLLAVLFAFAFVAAACGSSDDDDSSSSSSESASATAEDHSDDDDHDRDHSEEEEEEESSIGGGLTQDAVEEAAESGSEEAATRVDPADFDLTGIEGHLEYWAANRTAIAEELTAKIEAGDYGVGDDGILRGPAGFEIDMNECPSDWSDTKGITDSEIRMGMTSAFSGNLAAYGNLNYGVEAWSDYLNETGAFGDREVKWIMKDDGYVAAQTIEFIDELIESENVFAINTLGSPNTMAVYTQLNQECVPQPFVMTGHPAWGDPVNHPWTSGLQMSYSTEAILWGTWIKNNLADELPVKVAGLVMDNDFGLAYELAFEAYAEANGDIVSEFVAIRHDPAAPTVTNEMTTIAAAKPNVFISMTAGNPCLLAIQEADASGLLEDVSAAFTPSVCKGIAAYMAPAGMAADGWWIAGGGWKDTTDPNHIDEPYIAFVNQLLADADLDPSVSLYGTGVAEFGWPMMEVLQLAQELPGGLSRTNYILALRSFSGDHPFLLDGIAFGANGAVDGFFVEGSDFSLFDAEAQSWNIVGDIVDANGGSPNCAWDKDNGGCR